MQELGGDDRSSGVILHPTSLPGPYGIGDLGPEAHRWVDMLAGSGTSLWQILPVGPTGYGDSPYQCFSAFAGNANLVSPSHLADDGLIDPPPSPGFPDDHVDYGAVIPWKRQILAEAFARFEAGYGDPLLREDFERFGNEKNWLDDYALFMAIKAVFGGGSWQDWPDEFRLRETGTIESFRRQHAGAISLVRFSQFLFFRQWQSLRRHATDRGVRIIGDVPIFVAGDSADVWASPERFRLDEKRRPTVVAGVPPDYFSETGQLWGNPLYDWDHHAETGYAWWADRLRSTFDIADIARIDHFRAFADYWEISADAETAIDGVWRDGPGMAFFDAVRERLGALPIIAEDLGDLSDKVPELLDQTGFPGMRVLTFAFSTDESDSFLPHNYPVETVAYTGTHDNDTTLGWWTTAPEDERAFAARYLSIDPADPVAGFLEGLWDSRAMFAIAPLQDLLRLGSSARMNTPGTTDANWQWRVLPDQIADTGLATQLRHLNDRYERASVSQVS
ncbi:MAG: 4-alpha-glucanotransferase [Actinomycetota bacterium]|nr:4-alpha-glucanotransferase [Actinomycetota bacterium]